MGADEDYGVLFVGPHGPPRFPGSHRPHGSARPAGSPMPPK